LFGPIAAGAAVPYDVRAIEAAGEHLVDGMVAEAHPLAPGVQVERKVVAGGAARSIIDAAKGADLVAVGRRGHGGFSRLLLGSVSDQVVRHAGCPVVVVTAPGSTAA
jgi:nucleotide-binding universal stress UspA family protein